MKGEKKEGEDQAELDKALTMLPPEVVLFLFRKPSMALSVLFTKDKEIQN